MGILTTSTWERIATVVAKTLMAIGTVHMVATGNFFHKESAARTTFKGTIHEL
jgi:hypothetical protein